MKQHGLFAKLIILVMLCTARTYAQTGGGQTDPMLGGGQTDPLVGYYANTVTSKDTNSGAVSAIYLNRDKSYVVRTTDAKGQAATYSGTWSLKDDGHTVCLKPAPSSGGAAPQPSCTAVTTHAVGDRWTITNDKNQTFDLSLSAGR